jgi:hypothetical protein
MTEVENALRYGCSWHGRLLSPSCCECGMITFHRQTAVDVRDGQTVVVDAPAPQKSREGHEVQRLFAPVDVMAGQLGLEV